MVLRLDANAAGRTRGAAAGGRTTASGRARLVANHDPDGTAVGPVVHGLILLLRWFLRWFPFPQNYIITLVNSINFCFSFFFCFFPSKLLKNDKNVSLFAKYRVPVFRSGRVTHITTQQRAGNINDSVNYNDGR